MNNLYHKHHETLWFGKKSWSANGYAVKEDAEIKRYHVISIGKRTYRTPLYPSSDVTPSEKKRDIPRRWEFDLKRFELLVTSAAAQWAADNPEGDAFDAAYAATQEPNLFCDIWGNAIPSLPPKDAQWLQDLFEQVVEKSRNVKPLPDNQCMIAPPGYYSKWQWYQWGYFVPEDTSTDLFLKTADDTQPLYTYENVFPIKGEAALTRRLLYHREVLQHERPESS